MTKLLRHCPQMELLQRTKQSTSTPTSSRRWGCGFVSYRCLKQQHNKKEKLHLPFLKATKQQEGPLGQKVSLLIFGTDCSLTLPLEIRHCAHNPQITLNTKRISYKTLPAISCWSLFSQS